MKLNFKQYIEQEEKKAYLAEANQPTLHQLIDNFGKVFPYSKEDLPIVSSKIDGWEGSDMKVTGQVKSEDGSESYGVIAEFHRDSPETLWSIEMVGKVNCTCPAFRFNTAYPDAKNGVMAGQIPSYAKIANKVRNAQQLPSVCKHLYSFLHKFYESKLKNQKPVEKPEEETEEQETEEQNVNNRGDNENSQENTKEQGHSSTV